MRCIIIEDELPAQRIIKSYISKLPQLELVGCFQSAIAANQFLQSSKIDLLFLDINLPDISGMQYIKTLINPPKIIITTAYPEHAVESFELATILDYLVKPFSFERFLKGINKISKNEVNQSSENTESEALETIILNIDKTLYKVFIQDILYITSDRNYITLTTNTKKLTYVASLKNWIDKLPADTFIQIHKSYVVNSHKIDKIVGNSLYLENKKFPIGRFYKAALLKHFNSRQ